MAHRSPKQRKAHNKGVLHEARDLESDGWNVRADHLPDHDWESPPTIADHVPDVYARKAGHTRIVEIETDPEDDHEQHSAFRRHAGQKQNTVFYGWIVDSQGRRNDRFY